MSAQSNIIPLRPPGFLFEEAWRVMPSSMRKRSMSREKLLPLWRDHARKVGEEALLGALRAYVSDEDCRKWGGVALDRWLRNGRYDHYIDTAPTSAGGGLVAFPNLPIWTAVVDSLGEPWARSYLTQCGYEDGWLTIQRTKLTAIDKLRENRERLKACGVLGVRLTDG